MTSSSAWGRCPDVDAKLLQGRGTSLLADLMSTAPTTTSGSQRNLRPHLKNIKPAVLTVGGWFDAENLFGVLEAHRCFEADKANHVLVMGPWIHGGWNGGTALLGAVRFALRRPPSTTARRSSFPFFNFHLKGRGEWKRPKALVFETGTNRWREYPTPGRRRGRSRFPLPPRGRPRPEPPAEAEGVRRVPQRPGETVPYTDKIGTVMPVQSCLADQRFAARRPDVARLRGPRPLRRPLTLAGPMKATLHVSTTGTDADWVVKLIDVYPDDYPDPRPPTRRAVRTGRLSATRPRRDATGAASAKPRKPGAVQAGPADAGLVRAARRLPHLPPGPQDHGAGPEQLVPARRSQPADVRRHRPGTSVRLSEGNPPRLLFARRAVVSHRSGTALVSGAAASRWLNAGGHAPRVVSVRRRR